jgi:hypothetical protein
MRSPIWYWPRLRRRSHPGRPGMSHRIFPLQSRQIPQWKAHRTRKGLCIGRRCAHYSLAPRNPSSEVRCLASDADGRRLCGAQGHRTVRGLAAAVFCSSLGWGCWGARQLAARSQINLDSSHSWSASPDALICRIARGRHVGPCRRPGVRIGIRHSGQHDRGVCYHRGRGWSDLRSGRHDLAKRPRRKRRVR